MAGEPTADLIAEQLVVERESKRSIEQRALSVLATSGVIGALAGVAARSSILSRPTRVLLVIALVGFAIGALLAIWVAHPTWLDEVDEDSLARGLAPENWPGGQEENLRRAARARLSILAGYLTSNHWKACVLSASLVSLGSGIVFLLSAVIAELIHG